MNRLANNKTRIAGAVGTVLLYAAISSAAQAANFAYDASVAAGHSDNIRRTPTNEEGEDIAGAALAFSLDEQTARLQADLVGDLAYYEYLNDTYDSEVLGNFLGSATLTLVPDRFQWMAADSFGQVLGDPFAPSTPDNRENINYFTTGPDFTLGLGSQTRLRLSGRYSLTTYEHTPFDSSSPSAELALIRSLSSATSLSAHGRYQQVEYDDAALDGDYEQTEAFLRYRTSGARTHLSADVGHTAIERDADGDRESDLLLRFDASRRVSAASVVTLSLGREFMSSGAAFALAQAGGGFGLDAVPGRQTTQPFINEHVTLDWSYNRERISFGLYGSRTEQSYENESTLDQTTGVIGAQVHRNLSQAMGLTLRASHISGDFEQEGDYKDRIANLTFSWQLGAHVSLRTTYEYSDRDSDDPAGDYTENRFWISLGYGRGEPRSTVRPPEFAVDAQLPEN